jgi:hypothetical protein
LELLAGWTFHADGDEVCRKPRTPQIGDRPLDGPKTDVDVSLTRIRWTTTALPSAPPLYRVRASRRASSDRRRAAGRT